MAHDTRPETIGTLNRRAFMRAGAAATAMVGIAVRADADCAEASCDIDTLDALVSDRTWDAAKCQLYRGLEIADPVELLTEKANSFLWCIFAWNVWSRGGVSGISRTAVECLRGLTRDAVWDEADRVSGDLEQFDFSRFRPDWEQMGQHAQTIATGPELSNTEVAAAYSHVHGTGACPATATHELPDLPRWTEVAGTHLWFRFVIGVRNRDSSAPMFEHDVIAKGRGLSRKYVYANLDKLILPDGTLRWDGWCLNEVGDCGYLAGGRAARYARGAPISFAHFEQAWCSVKKGMDEYRLRCQQVVIQSGACA